MPYSDTYDVITDVPVVTGATLWMSPHDGDEFILIFNEALWMGDTLQHTLVNPNQLRAYGTTVQDNPFSSTPLKFEPPTGAILVPQVTVNIRLSVTFISPHLRHGIHTMWSSRAIVWRRKNPIRRYRKFPRFLLQPTTPPQHNMTLWPSIHDYSPQYKSTHNQKLPKSYPRPQHSRAKVDILLSHHKT